MIRESNTGITEGVQQVPGLVENASRHGGEGSVARASWKKPVSSVIRVPGYLKTGSWSHWFLSNRNTRAQISERTALSVQSTEVGRRFS